MRYTPDDGAAGGDALARQRRVETLRRLAQAQRVDAPADAAIEMRETVITPTMRATIRNGSPARSRRPSRRPWWALGGALLALVVVAAAVGGYYLTTRPHGHTSQATTLPTQVTIHASGCPYQQVWSPNGQTLATLSALPPCASPDTSLLHTSLTLYSAATGNAHQQLALSTVQAVTQNPGNLVGMGWSPDGKTIVMDIDISQNIIDTATRSAMLLLIPTNGGQPTAMRQSEHVTETNQYTNFAPIWNIRTKRIVAVLPDPMPAALTYRWTTNGQLAPGQPFPTGGATSYTGRPQANGAILFWQDGVFSPVYPELPNSPFTPDPSKPPAAVLFTTGPVAVWSPDGSEVTFEAFTGLFADQQLTTQMCAQLVLQPYTAPACPASQLTAPNAAVAALVAAALHPVPVTIAGAAVSFYQNTQVAWSPHGSLVATVLPADQFETAGETSRSREPIKLFSTANGAQTAQRVYQCDGAAACQTGGLAWSPTGNQLAFIDSGNGIITLWNTQQLHG
jgi:Tol biopolymer transport system component